MPNPQDPADSYQIDLLMGQRELEVRGAFEGSSIWLAFDEIGAEGWATVTEVADAQLDDGAGCLVTATVNHLNSAVLSLSFSDSEPLAVTKYHRIWSFDRGEWVTAEDLVVGESAQDIYGGPWALRASVPFAEVVRVYNFTVADVHEYFVGSRRLLVHNSCSGDPPVTVLQSTGNTITRKTAKALGLTREQAKDAMHALKPKVGAGGDMVGIIKSNGDYFDPETKELLGNLHEWVQGHNRLGRPGRGRGPRRGG